MADLDHKAQPTNIVSICSADGWNSLVFEFKSRLSTRNGVFFVCSVSSDGKFWDREQTVTSEMMGELVPDYEFHLLQVILSEERLRECRDHLQKWLSNPFAFELQLSAPGEPTLTLFMGERDDFISKIDRPVFSLRYNSSRMKAESCFVIDQSCVNLFLQGLNRWL